MFEASISKNRYVLYLPKEHQEKLKRFHGRKAKVIVIIESN